MQELNQVSIWDVVDTTTIAKTSTEISKIEYSWYKGGFFDLNDFECNHYYVEIENNIKKTTVIIDRYGRMDQIVFEEEILKPNIFWKNINKIDFSNVQLDYTKHNFDMDRFCIKANDEKILAGPFAEKKRDKNLNKFLKLINAEEINQKVEKILEKYRSEIKSEALTEM